MGSAQCVFREDIQAAPELPNGILEVTISVYQLNLLGSGFINSLGSFIVGAYHSAVVVGGEEWAFGGHTDELKSGVYKIPPTLDPHHVFFQKVVMGRMEGTREQVRDLITAFALQPQWRGTAYDLLERNCNHFASSLCWLLLRRRPPFWINSTVDTMARKMRVQRVEHAALKGALEAYIRKNGEDASPMAVDTQAFADEFLAVFGQVWRAKWAAGQKAAVRCGIDEDPEQLRSEFESESLAGAAGVAGTAATILATVLSMGAAARNEVPEVGLSVYDDVWGRESSRLIQHWRAEAMEGVLDVGGGTEERKQTVEAAITCAKLAAHEACDRKCVGVCGPRADTCCDCTSSRSGRTYC
eukprot:TRINITY_DN31469_c0_g1_i1.p1 TRINITY_DN31469_c0_g1~~TRINITY_DN31469_c0_g1_i1.p1  ORF type:complete len:356 (-),score=76.73 TRINITY_DN31469_c0_g1_i1:33-1100(-)